jgi:hypothetical protein
MQSEGEPQKCNDESDPARGATATEETHEISNDRDSDTAMSDCDSQPDRGRTESKYDSNAECGSMQTEPAQFPGATNGTDVVDTKNGVEEVAGTASQLRDVKNAQVTKRGGPVCELPGYESITLLSGASFVDVASSQLDPSADDYQVVTHNKNLFFAGKCALMNTHMKRMLYTEVRTIYLGGAEHSYEKLKLMERISTRLYVLLGKVGIIDFSETTKINAKTTCVSSESFGTENNKKKRIKYFFQKNFGERTLPTASDTAYSMSKFELSTDAEIYPTLYLTLKNNPALMKRRKVDANGDLLVSLETAAMAVLTDATLIKEFRLWAEDPRVFGNTMVFWFNQMDAEGNYLANGTRPLNRRAPPPPIPGAPASASSTGSGRGK